MYLKICYFDTSRWIGPVSSVTKVGVFTARIEDPLMSVLAVMKVDDAVADYADLGNWDVGTFVPMTRTGASPLESQMGGPVLDAATERLAMLIVADVYRPDGNEVRTGFVIQNDHGVYLMSASGETIDRLGA